jgi:hypothetical protein
MDRLFCRSGLMRAKWDKRHGAQTYGEGTIAKAIAQGGPFYTPRDRSTDAAARDAWERKAWSMTPAWVHVRLGGVGELACRVYGIIACYASKKGEAWPAVERIASTLRVSERRVKSAIAKLKAAGLLTSTPRPCTSSLYRLTLTVPETITPYVMRVAAPRMTESGHLGCRSHGRVTNQEPTIVDTGEALMAALSDTKPLVQKGPSFSDACIQQNRGARRPRDETAVDRYPEWDGTTNSYAGVAFLWDYAEEKLGLIGPRVLTGKTAIDFLHGLAREP